MPIPVAAGIDVGSTTCKAVVIDGEGQPIAHCVEPADPHIEEQARRLIEQVRNQAGAHADLPLAATGYGRKRVTAARVLTEITCHARGAFHLAGLPGMLIDVGGQDTKVIHIGPEGRITDFVMNDKCAAGTGRFLEVILGRLRVSYDQVAQLVAQADRAVPISSTCTVFAESEVISRLAGGEPLDGIVKGLHQALASRIVALAGRLPADAPVMMSGGVALNQAMVQVLSAAAAHSIAVLPDPQFVGALGAALAVAPP